MVVKWKIKWFKLILIIVFSTIVNQIYCQEANIKFESYSTNQGLSQGSVLAVAQDDEGFMWFGTYGGLNRFDGYNMINFIHSDDQPSSLADNHIRAICQESKGVLLVATVNGLDRFFTGTGQFVHFKNNPNDSSSISNNQVYDVVKDKDGDIWLGTWGGGLNKMERITGKYSNEQHVKYRFVRYKLKQDQGNYNSNEIADLQEGPDGNIWIASRNGLNKFDKKKKEFTAFKHNPNNPNSLSSNNISSICFDTKDDIWVGTWDGGVNRINLKTNKVTRFYQEQGNKFSLSYNKVMCLFCDKSGTVWVGTWGGGLNRISINEDQKTKGKKEEVLFYSYQYSKIDLTSIGSNSIYEIFQDRTGVLWAGTDWGGVSKFKQVNTKFRHIYSNQSKANSLVNNVVFSFLFDKDDVLWIGTIEGLNKYNLRTKQFESFLQNPSNPNSISDNQVRSILKTRDSTLWIGSFEGLNKYNPKTNNFTRYYIDPLEQGNSSILKLFESSDGYIWIGTYNDGLYKFDPKTETFEKVVPKTANTVSTLNDIVWTITEDKNSCLWIGMVKGGLYKYNLKTKKFTSFTHNPNDEKSISSNYILSLLIDHNQNLWIGTANGLNKLILEKNDNPNFIKYTKEDGLPDQLVNGIVEDNAHQLWISSSKGLTRFNPEVNFFKNFTPGDGLQDYEFSINAIIKDEKTGEIYAGGINGFNIFNPKNITFEGITPSVKNVELKIFNKSVKLNERINNRIILEKLLSAKDNLELSYKENVFSIDYAALHYDSPSSIKYAFMLEGFDKDWNYVGNQRSATYTNLKPGNYIFKVKAANPDGYWSENPTELQINIKPPWWDTLVAKIFFVILIVSAILIIYRLRIRLLLNRQKELEKVVKSRTLELQEANILLEEKSEEITIQNEELKQHRDNLEKLVEERTVELSFSKIKAEESDKLKSSFLANMSHEVRTPMNAIIGFSTLLEDDELKKSERDEFIRHIQTSGNTLITLIDDILDISLIEANQLKLNKQRIYINEIMLEILSYHTLTNSKHIDIEYVNKESKFNPCLLIDPIRFKQIMNNLMTNALKYTEIGYVRFGYVIVQNFVEIFVEDTGIGISQEAQQNIFNYFYKIEESKTKIYRGTGIGLSICKELAILMGFNIKVKSELGKGSRFYFSIPLINEPNREFIEATLAKDNFNLKDVKIVVAEDDENNFELIKRILSKNGVIIYWAKNGKEAVDLSLDLFRQNIEFLILMDIKMPVMNGIDALNEIKMISKNIPVIAVTAFAQTSEKVEIMKHPFDDYMSKPINAQILLKKLSDLAKK